MMAMWARWAPPLERSRLIAMSASGGSFGAFVALPLTGYICQMLGWPTVFYICGEGNTHWCHHKPFFLPWRQLLFSSLLSLPNLLILLIIHLLFQAVLVASGQSFGLSLCQMTLAPIAESAKRSEITSLKPSDHRYEWNVNRYLFTLILVCVSVRGPCYNLTKQILCVFYTPYIYLELFV